MIRIQNIVKKFPTVTALDGVTLEVAGGEFFGLLGPNGAGKSTLMNLLVGYLDPDGGEIRIDDEPINRDSFATRRKIGFVPQSLALYEDISAQENLEIFGSFFDIGKKLLRERIKDQLNAVQLYDRRKDHVKTFSGGMKRRLNLVAGILHDPPLLLCDEPTVGVDPQSRNAIFDYLELLNKAGKTIVYTTHYMEEAERLCSKIAIIDNGRIVAHGTLDDLLAMLIQEESIALTNHPSVVSKLDLFREFGTVLREEDRLELVPGKDIHLSSFFALLEREHIPYHLVEVRRPTLEALFLHLTGRSIRD